MDCLDIMGEIGFIMALFFAAIGSALGTSAAGMASHLSY